VDFKLPGSKLAALAAVFCFCAGGARAQTFTNSSYMRDVFAASPELKSAEESVRIADNSYFSTLIETSLPSLSLTAGAPLYGFSDLGGWEGARLNRNEVSSSARADWNLFNSGRDMLALKSARYSKDIAELQLKQLRQGLALSALSTYYNLLLKYKLLDVARGNLRDQESQNAIAKSLYENGLQKLTDMLQSDTDLRSSQLRLAQAEADYQNALVNFNSAIDRDPLADCHLDETLNISSAPLPSPERDTAKALAQRYEILQAEINFKSSQNSYKRTLLDNLPEFRVDAFWSKNGLVTFGLPGSGAVPDPDYGVTAALNIPIGFFWQSQKNKVSSAMSAQRQTANALESGRRSVRGEVVSSRVALNLQQRSLDLAEFKTKIAKQKLELIQEQYRQGATDSIHLTQAQSDYLDSQNQYTNALYQTVLNTAQYKKSLGEPLWEQP